MPWRCWRCASEGNTSNHISIFRANTRLPEVPSAVPGGRLPPGRKEMERKRGSPVATRLGNESHLRSFRTQGLWSGSCKFLTNEIGNRQILVPIWNGNQTRDMVRGTRVSTAAIAIENLLSRSRSGHPSPQKDRRRAKRHRMDLPARFRIYLASRPEHSSREIPAQVIDLARTGIGLLADSVENGGLHIMHPWTATSEQCLLEIQILHRQNTPDTAWQSCLVLTTRGRKAL